MLSPFRSSKGIQIIIQHRYSKTQRQDESPENPEVVCDEYVVALAVEVEELRAENSLGRSINE